MSDLYHMGGLYRQGDILLAQVRGLPKRAKRQKRTRGEGIIVASGEVTGHHHRIRDRSATQYTTSNTNQMFIKVGRMGAKLTHEEHDTIDLPEGTFQVVRQKEYQPTPPSSSALPTRTTRRFVYVED